MNGSVYKGARLKWVEERKTETSPFLDLREHEVANRKSECGECKDVVQKRR
jgi:hypothetical protein